MTNLQEEIKAIIMQHDIVLFMKGTKGAPQCGFSSQVAHILDDIGKEYHDINVLDNEDIRHNIKIFSDWPTIPQLYIKGEFVGGCDIVTELYQSGELLKMI